MSAPPPNSDPGARQSALSGSGASILQIAATELLERIKYFALEPAWVLLLGSASHETAQGLISHVPHADLVTFDGSAAASRRAARGWWPRRQSRHPVSAQVTALPLKAQTADLACINLLLPACPRPDQVLREVARVMRPGALLQLSSLGPRSLPELAAPCDHYPDLPQLGDLLLGSGFTEPVMDIEHHQIRYASGTALAQELRRLSLDHAITDPHAHTLTYELIVATAFAASTGGSRADRTPGEVAISLSSLRRRKS